jgi:hypothetical protein
MCSRASQTGSKLIGSSWVCKEKLQVQDERAVAVNMGSFKNAKRNYNVIKDGLSADYKVNKVIEKPMVKSLRPGSGDRTDVVFADKANAKKVMLHTRWL